MKVKSIILAAMSLLSMGASAQEFDMTQPQPTYSDAVGYGYDFVDAPTAKSTAPFYFSVKVPDGNYRVTVTLGNKKKAGETIVRAESRRLMMNKCVTKKGQFETFSFIVNKRNVDYVGSNGKADKVKIKSREVGSQTWDDKL